MAARRSKTQTGGGAETKGHIPGLYSLAVGMPPTQGLNGWTWRKLSDVARLETGHTPSRKKPEYWGGDIPWVGIRDATANHGRTIHDTNQHTNQLGIDNSSARILPKNTVCLSRTASVGYVVVMGRPMATSQDFVNWVCSKDIDHHFLKYILLSENRSFASFASGTTHQTIYFPEVKGFHVCLPPLPIQRKIASILSAYDDLIENNTRRIAILEEMAQAIYREWFVHFRFPGHENVQLVDSPLGQIPEGWEIVPLSSLTDPKRRITYGVVKPGDHDPEGVRFVRGGDIIGGQVDVNALRTITREVSNQYKRTLLQGGELLVSLVGNPGEVAIAPKSLLGANIARQVGLVVIDDNMSGIYVKNYLMSPHGKDELFAHTTGSVQKVINLANLKMVRVIVPPSEILKRTMPFFADQEAQLQNLRNRNNVLRTTRDLLLPKLISGKLDVEDLDTGELAEELEEATA